MKEVIVTMRDVRESGLCVRGAKKWFDSRGIDFRHFLAHGAPASQVEAIGDAMANRVLEAARKRAGGK